MDTGIPARKFISTLVLGAASFLFVGGMGVVAPALAAPSVAGLPDFTDMVEKAGPAVVNIRTTAKMRPNQNGGTGSEDEEMQEFFRRFFGVPMPRQPERTPRGNGKAQPP